MGILTDERFSRVRLLVGEQELERISNLRITLVGLGAVGSHALEALVRYGAENIRLVDFDVIKYSNFNRQLLATETSLGKQKVQAARERALDINPRASIECFEQFCHEESFAEIFDNRPDIVIDAIDGVTPKVKMIAYLKNNGIRVVSSMGAALAEDPSFIRVGDISETKVCKLAAEIRKRLRYEGIANGVPCVYSIEPRKPSSIGAPEADNFERGRERKPMGSSPIVTGCFGYYLAKLAIDASRI